MIRAAALVLLLAIVALAASGALWVRAAGTLATPGNPDGIVDDLSAIADVDLGARYTGRAELLDPRVALPRWHAHPRAQASALFLATRDCSGTKPSVELTDPALAKAWEWHQRSCANGDLAELLARPPLVHPSGRSYAALGLARMPARPDVARSLHVVELSSAPADALDAEGRALSTIGRREWESIARGDRLVLAPNHLLVADPGPLGIARVRTFDRRAFEARARRSSLALVPRSPQALCTRPASSTLCWQTITTADRDRGVLVAVTSASAAIALLAAAALAFAIRRDRQRANADRLHILRTLTHELRTPAMSLGLDIEPLRAAYDEIPSSVQEPLLRISDGVARLNRVLHRTARYLELFERTTKIDLDRHVVSAKETFADMADEWPEGVTLEGPDVDATINVDVGWLSVAVRNLAENAVRHGKAPATVSWHVEDGHLVVRVKDAGTSEGLTIRSIRAHRRDPSSKGLGLGLAIVSRVAELLGGTLTHEPSPTTFVLRVPA